jgi:transcriptional regulator with XRE-family HTH domain
MKSKGGKKRRTHAPAGSIGARVTEERQRQGLDLVDLAKACKITVQSISELERGITKSPKPENVFAIADRLGINPRWFVFGPPAPRTLPLKLSQAEAELIELFRTALDDNGREALLAYGRGLASATASRDKPPKLRVAK